MAGSSMPDKGGGAAEKEELKLPQLVPAPPPSPFVTRLRGEVCASRGSDGGVLQSSFGRRRSGDAGRRVSFGDAEVTEVDDERPRSRPPVYIELEIKVSSAIRRAGKPLTLEAVDTRTAVADVKAKCQSHCTLPVEQQRLFYKGKLLQDVQTLEGAGVPNRAALFLVKGASAKQTIEDSAEAEQRKHDLAMEELRSWAPSSQGPMCMECGVNPGRLQTNGLCGICWREQVVRENKELKRRREEAKRREEENATRQEEERRHAEEFELRRQKDTSRCYQCNKKTGLTGFQCQCGYFFCAKHRHAEEHSCSFDFVSHGRELLAQQVKLQRSPSSSD